MVNFFGKTIMYRLLTSVLLSLGCYQTSLAENTAKVAVPLLPLFAKNNAFVARYPNTAKAMQIELYTTNLSYHAITESDYHPKSDTLSPSKLRELEACTQDFYTADRLNRLYQKMSNTLPKNELSELEDFYRSDVGQRYLNSKLHLAQLLKEKGLKSYLTMTDTHAIIKDNEADMPVLEKFITSKPYNDYFEIMDIKAFSKAEQDSQQCVAKVAEKTGIKHEK